MYTIAHILNLFLSLLCVVQNQELAASRPASTRPAPPKARIEIVVDDYHGHKVADPYRWLEDGNSAETQRFVDAENAYTQQLLDSLRGKDKLRARLEQSARQRPRVN